MVNHYYLVAALPYLRFGEKPAMDAAQFRAFCADWLALEEQQAVEAVLDGQPAANGLTAAWHAQESRVRSEIARVRARRYNLESAARPSAGYELFIENGVADAFARDNPLEREMELDRLRWKLADETAAGNPFRFAAVLAYAVKLRIAERWTALDEPAGRRKVEEMVLSAMAAGESEPATSNG